MNVKSRQVSTVSKNLEKYSQEHILTLVTDGEEKEPVGIFLPLGLLTETQRNQIAALLPFNAKSALDKAFEAVSQLPSE